METKRVRLALFTPPAEDYVLALRNDRTDGSEPQHYGYIRISEWIDVDFPMRETNELAENKRKETEALRANLQKQLANLDKKPS